MWEKVFQAEGSEGTKVRRLGVCLLCLNNSREAIVA